MMDHRRKACRPSRWRRRSRQLGETRSVPHIEGASLDGVDRVSPRPTRSLLETEFPGILHGVKRSQRRPRDLRRGDAARGLHAQHR